MSLRGWMGLLRAGSALGLLVIATAQAHAGGFALREQSTYGQGASFAGIAAGGALSSMFWNPATMTQVPGIQSETDITGIFPFSTHTPAAGSTAFILGPASNSGEMALVPGSYLSYQLYPNLWLGYSVNAPFGLSVTFPEAWAGRNYAGDSNLKTYNATPSIAYRINDWISVGAGVQIQYASAHLRTGLGSPATPFTDNLIQGTGWAYGATAGITLMPTPATTVGLGWRSALNQKIDGSLILPAIGGPFNPPASSPGAVNTTIRLPDIVSLGIRQRLDPQWTLLGTVEWSNWSRIGSATVVQPSGAVATIATLPVIIPFKYDDGWFFSLGTEYRWTDRLTVRGGVGYEITPIKDQVRTPRLPDNDRFWASIGASWQVFKGLSFDIAYSHLWVKDPSINISATSGNPFFNPAVPITYIGSVDAHVDIVSAAIVVRFDDIEPTLKRPFATR